VESCPQPRGRRNAGADAFRAELVAERIALGARDHDVVGAQRADIVDLAHELRCLEILGRFAEVVPTFLPLHAVPPERRGEPDGRARFLDEVLRVWLPAVLAQGAARFIDAYVDATGFSVAEAEPVLRAALARGLRARLHLGQFADVGGAALAASLGAASADHLEHLDDDGARALAAAGVVGVLLPGAALSLGQSMPDARRLRELGMDLALGTDCNPGTSHTDALPLMATLAVRQMGMSTPEAWHAITRVAARALDLERVAAEVDAVHLVNRIVGIAWIVVLQESKLDLDGDVANTAELAKKLVQLALTDVSGQISDVNPAHRAIRLNNS
jgi:imidazolonepropionase